MPGYVDMVKEQLLKVPIGELNLAIEMEEIKPQLILVDDYNVTFEDPSKPPETTFKRFQCISGNSFYLKAVRSTSKNPIIFRFTPDRYISNNLANWSKGPGLTKPWTTAEFTLAQIKQERVNAAPFLQEVLDLYSNWSRGRLHDLYDAENAGSW